jgi:hypothetical protein
MPKGNPSPKRRVPETRPWQERLTVPLPEAAQILGIGRSTAYLSAEAGEIPVLTFGRRKVVPTAWIKKAIEGPDRPVFAEAPAGEAA